MSTDPSNSKIHVALVEDDVYFQNTFTMAISSTSDMKLVGVASSRAEGLKLLLGAPADVLVVDLGLPDGSGIDVIQASQRLWIGCNVMVNTSFGDEAHVLMSIEAGAAGYLLKDASPSSMMNEIRSLNAGGSPISPVIARQVLTRFRQSSPTRPATPETAVLSAREKEVLEMITKGFTANEIAGLMGVSQHTVQTYVRRIYAKLEVNSRTEAINEARCRGLLAS